MIAAMNAGTNRLNRRELLKRVIEFGLVGAIALFVIGQFSASAAPAKANSLKPPAKGHIPVAFLISNGAVIIDFCGPWEVFRDVMIPGSQDHPFKLYTVSESTSPIRAGGGMQIIPDYTLKNAPAPKVIVIPAQSEPS